MHSDDLAAVVERLLGVSVQPSGVLQRQDAEIETVVRLDREGDRGSVIAKRGRSFDPADPTPTPKSAWALFNEWASLEFLSKVCPGVAPELIAADRVKGVLVLEDLGDHPSLADVLHGHDRVVAEERLLELARTLGRMHSTTRPLIGEFQALRDGLGPGGVLDGYLDLPAANARFRQACERIGSPPPPETDEVFATRGGLALTHGDIGPGNECVTSDGLRLLDFEVAGAADPMIEAALLRMLLEQGEADYAVPDELVTAMEHEYRAHAPLPSVAYERGCAYVFCMELGGTWRDGQPSETQSTKSSHRARAFLGIHEAGSRAFPGVATLAALIARDNALPTWPALR